VWISGLLWKGQPWELLRLAEAGEMELCMAPAMIEELAQVLAYGEPQPRLEQLNLSATDLLAYAIDLASVFDVPETGAAIVEADPEEDIFVLCAVAAGAAYVASGDHHLLDLEEYADIPILTVHDLLDREFPQEGE
jgi:putative PIN family toxin of toxin-antitoxin system